MLDYESLEIEFIPLWIEVEGMPGVNRVWSWTLSFWNEKEACPQEITFSHLEDATQYCRDELDVNPDEVAELAMIDVEDCLWDGLDPDIPGQDIYEDDHLYEYYTSVVRA